MMRSIVKYAVAVVAFATITSCNSFLDIKPESEILPENFWKDERDANAGVIAIYNNFSKAISPGMWNWGELRGDNYDPYGRRRAYSDRYIKGAWLRQRGYCRKVYILSGVCCANAD